MRARRIGMIASRRSGEQFQAIRAGNERDTVTQFPQKFPTFALELRRVGREIEDGTVGLEQSRRAVQSFELVALDIHFD
jgi:hypothetical protein